MLNIDGTNIELTRGDTARIQVDIIDNDEPYEIKVSDTILMTIKKKACQEKVYLQKKANINGVFTIYPEDTKNMFFGEYEYDIQLEMNPLEVYTIIPVSKFTILKEIT